MRINGIITKKFKKIHRLCDLLVLFIICRGITTSVLYMIQFSLSSLIFCCITKLRETLTGSFPRLFYCIATYGSIFYFSLHSYKC